VKKRAQEMGIEGRSTAELAKNPKIFEMVKMAIEEKNQELAKYETIKRFAIIETEFSIDSGELTPTLKVKRKLINERYKDIFDSLYSE
jgi:long-chain acyl-CoA synthetase